jgi:ATP-binding cassette subfamily B protein
MKIKALEKQTRHSGMFRLLQTAGGFSLLAFALAANIGEGIGNAFAASAAGRMLDAFIGGERRGAVEYMIQGIAFAALLAVSIVVKDSLLGSYQERGMVRLREKTIAALGRSRMDWLDGHHTGELSSRATGDLNALGNALRPVLIMGLSRTFAQLIVVFYLFQMNWVLTLTIFAVVPVTTVLQWVGSSPIKRYQQVNRSAAAQLSAVVADCAGAFETVKSLNLETEMRRRFSTVNGEQYEAGVRENRVAALLAPLSTLGGICRNSYW